MPADILLLFGLSALLSVATASYLARHLSPETDVEPAARRIGHLDGLRGYLAVSVLLHHSAIYVIAALNGGRWATPHPQILNQLGAGAVALFFMVSGTVFYPLVLKGVEADWLGFFVKRFFRIVPLVTISVALVVAVLAATTGSAPGSEDIVPFLTWVSSWAQPPLLGVIEARYLNAQVLWSLQWEWLFYFLLLPFCALLRSLLRAGDLPTLFIPATLLLLSIAGRLLGWEVATMTEATWVNTLPLFAAGMLAFECRSRPAWESRLGGLPSSAVAVTGLVAAALLSHNAYGWSMPLFGFAFITVACGNSFAGLLKSKAALALGELSFSIYLLHGLVLWVGFHGFAPMMGKDASGILLTMPLLAALTVALAYVANRTVERPSMLAGERIAKALARARAATVVNGLARLGS
ncbi:acyltransferase [Sphingomonas humi]|uniref:Acyltransferase 3 domain-containing protein n=1 Tax=Sphingomonas humi TaxID=335630 RepID=A0ABP7S7P4_9SPHN